MKSQQDVDVVVIGSGAGGLSAAVALAQAGKKVLVLEQHYLPGGWCHTFELEGYHFSPGVHYIGGLGAGGRLREVYEGLGVDLLFHELNPDGYDHFRVGDQTFDLPRGREAMIERYIERFPHERKGIERYFHYALLAAGELDAASERTKLMDWLLLPWRTRNMVWWGLMRLQPYMDKWIEDPLLKAFLSMQAGDHGIPPSETPMILHAAIHAHYLDGAFYPRGGGRAIPKAFLKRLRALGGDIRVSAEVVQILIEQGEVRGVALADGTEILAPTVISNADPEVTYGRLIGRDHLPPWLTKKLDATVWSTSCLSMFMAADLGKDPVIDSGNYWYADDTDIDGMYKLAGQPAITDELDRFPGTFVTVTSMKDRTRQRGPIHTVESFVFVPWESTARWAQSSMDHRPDDYLDFKKRTMEKMIDVADRALPGLRDGLVFQELGTPLSNQHYTGGTRGQIYGPKRTRDQLGPWGFDSKTPFGGLHLCGASALSHGVSGATISGLQTAGEVMGVPCDTLLTGSGTIETMLASAVEPRGPREQTRAS